MVKCLLLSFAGPLSFLMSLDSKQIPPLCSWVSWLVWSRAGWESVRMSGMFVNAIVKLMSASKIATNYNIWQVLQDCLRICYCQFLYPSLSKLWLTNIPNIFWWKKITWQVYSQLTNALLSICILSLILFMIIRYLFARCPRQCPLQQTMVTIVEYMLFHNHSHLILFKHRGYLKLYFIEEVKYKEIEHNYQECNTISKTILSCYFYLFWFHKIFERFIHEYKLLFFPFPLP